MCERRTNAAVSACQWFFLGWSTYTSQPTQWRVCVDKLSRVLRLERMCVKNNALPQFVRVQKIPLSSRFSWSACLNQSKIRV